MTSNKKRTIRVSDVFKTLLAWFLGTVIIVVLFPLSLILWVVLSPFDRNRTAIHRMVVATSVALVKAIPLWKVKVEGRENVNSDEAYVFISNHQSILDIIVIGSLCYKFKWVSKKENGKVPFLGWYLKMADYILIERGSAASSAMMYNKARKFLEDKISIMMFPEGTRSKDGHIGVFRQGAFKIAIDNNTPVLPVVIDGTGDILPKNGFVISGGHDVRVRILKPVYPSSFGTDNPHELARKMRQIVSSAHDEISVRQ